LKSILLLVANIKSLNILLFLSVCSWFCRCLGFCPAPH